MAQVLDWEALQRYDKQLKEYIDMKIAEAIDAYREEDKADDDLFEDFTDEGDIEML